MNTKELDSAVTDILMNNENCDNSGRFRMWRMRHKRNALSLDIKFRIVEMYGKKRVTININDVEP